MFHRGLSALFDAVYPGSEDELVGNSRKGKARDEIEIEDSEDSDDGSIGHKGKGKAHVEILSLLDSHDESIEYKNSYHQTHHSLRPQFPHSPPFSTNLVLPPRRYGNLL